MRLITENEEHCRFALAVTKLKMTCSHTQKRKKNVSVGLVCGSLKFLVPGLPCPAVRETCCQDRNPTIQSLETFLFYQRAI